MSNSFNGDDSLSSPSLYHEHPAGMPVPLDMTALYAIERQMNDITRTNSITGPLLMQSFLRGMELAASFLARLTFDYEQAKTKTKEAYSIAILDKADGELEKRKLKSTEENRKAVALLDADYRTSKNQEDLLKALVTLMENKLSRYEHAHNDVKKIYDKSPEPRGSSGSLPSSKDTQ